MGLLGCDGELLTHLGESFTETTRPDATRAPEAPPRATPGPAQLRLLNSLEFKHTVEDLLGLTVTAPLGHADWGAGFDSGAGGQMQENLFNALVDESQSLASRYVATRLAADFPCFDRANVTDACVNQVLEKLGRRAWRRPLTGDEKVALGAGFLDAATIAGSRVAGLETLIARLLLSPQFLYRSEIGAAIAAGSDLRALTAYERATMVAYALTASMPDDALLGDAEAGLLDDARLRLHVRRLWATPRARERMADVVRQWLGLTTLDDMAARPEDFAKLNPELGAALKSEFDATVAATLFDGAGTLPALFTSNFAMVNRHTASLYGLSVPGDELTRVQLPATERKGVLTLVSTMSALSSSADVSKDRPVMRGLMIKSRVLCEPVGPPSGVNTIAAANAASSIPNFDQLTTREQYEAMMQQGQACAACHATFMPLGFSFGRYDALGQHRTTQRGRPVNSLAAGVPLLGEVRQFDDALGLIDTLAGHERTAACFTKNLVSYATGVRGTASTDSYAALLHFRAKGQPLHVGQLMESVLLSPEVFERVGVVELSPPPMGGGGGATGGGGGSTGGGGGNTPDAGSADAGSSMPAPATPLLPSGVALGGNESRRSSDGAFTLVYQLDGNLVLYRTGGAPLWSSRTGGNSVGQAAMQGDGNLVVYDSTTRPRFNTGTQGNSGAGLFIESSGRLSVRRGGLELWNSITGRTP
jgi:hypothetical protein